MRHDTLHQFNSLLPIYLWLLVGVAVIVYGVIAFALVRYRYRADRVPSTRTETPRLEILYALLLACIACGLIVVTFYTEHRIDSVSAHPGLRVDVTASQWNWRFRYPRSGVVVDAPTGTYPTLVVPTDTTVQFTLVSKDVIHAFFIPALRYKRWAFPGRDHVNTFDLVFDKPGKMLGQCAEFCGWNHSGMRFAVRALPPDQFRAWLRRRVSA